MKTISLFLKWILSTHLKPTGVVFQLDSKDHYDGCQCCRRCISRNARRDAVVNGWTLLRRTIRLYKCSQCKQGFYSLKKRKICKRYSCYVAVYS